MALLLHPLINPVMLKRPLHSRFGPKVLAGIKCTTIRDTPWPVGKPIMLYHWSARAYNSPQVDVAAVQVLFTCPIIIIRLPNERMSYQVDQESFAKLVNEIPETHPLSTPSSDLHLWQLEGFDSREDMDTWFRAKLKPGQTVHKHLMRFKLLNLEPGT